MERPATYLRHVRAHRRLGHSKLGHMPVIDFGPTVIKTENATITVTCGAVAPASTSCLIRESERKNRWPLGCRPDGHPRLQVGLHVRHGVKFLGGGLRIPASSKSCAAISRTGPSLAQAHPAQTRQILRKLLPSRIRVWRKVRGGEKSYHFEGEAAIGRLLNGLVNIESVGVPNGRLRADYWKSALAAASQDSVAVDMSGTVTLSAVA